MDFPTALPPRTAIPRTISDPARILDDYRQYLGDESGLVADGVTELCFPQTTDEVSGLFARASRERTPVTISGARTGLVGGAVPTDGILCNLERMDRVLDVRADGDGYRVRVQPGITIRGLREQLAQGLPALKRDLAGFCERLWQYPVNPTEDTAQIGGTISTNASGSRSLRHGVTRQHVHGLVVVLPTGHILDVPRGRFRAQDGRFMLGRGDDQVLVPCPTYKRPPAKNAAGYWSGQDIDLVDLFIGAEGTLGVIVEAELGLVSRPSALFSGLLFFPDLGSALSFVRRARGDVVDGQGRPDGLLPLSLELFDHRSLALLDQHRRETTTAEYPGFPDGVGAALMVEQELFDDDVEAVYEAWAQLAEECGSDMETAWGGFDDAASRPIIGLRHALPEQVNALIARNRAHCPTVHKVAADMAVPDSRLLDLIAAFERMFEQADMPCMLYGHVGQSHLHANLLPADDKELATAVQLIGRLANEVVAMDGSPMVEHGVGRLKTRYLELLYGHEGLQQMSCVRRALDPAGICNPNVMARS